MFTSIVTLITVPLAKSQIKQMLWDGGNWIERFINVIQHWIVMVLKQIVSQVHKQGFNNYFKDSFAHGEDFVLYEFLFPRERGILTLP